MSKKDYISLSAALHKSGSESLMSIERHREIKLNQWRQDIDAIVATLKVSNPRFDAWKFLQACAGDSEQLRFKLLVS